MTDYLVQRYVESVDLLQTVGTVSEDELVGGFTSDQERTIALVEAAYKQTSMDTNPRDQHRIFELGTEAVLYPYADDETGSEA